MPPAYVRELAAGKVGTSGTANNTITLGAGASSGATVSLGVATRDTSTAGASVSDSRGNTWSVHSVQNPGNNCVSIPDVGDNLTLYDEAGNEVHCTVKRYLLAVVPDWSTFCNPKIEWDQESLL